MTTMQLVVAKRSAAWFKMGVAGPSGAGKTLSSLLFAFGMLKEKYPKLSDAEVWAKIAIVDTENASGQLYVGTEVAGIKVGAYNAIVIDAPFKVEKYIRAIDICVEAGMEVIIIDSLTHAWSAEGGLLEVHGNIAKRIGNSFSAWREITPQHNLLVSKLLQSPAHIIATIRSKQEYLPEEQNGRKVITKKGMEPEQRKGMEYEFTTFLDIDADHSAFGAKDRTSIYDQRMFVITPEEGAKAMKWLLEADRSPVEVVHEKKEELIVPKDTSSQQYKDVLEKEKEFVLEEVKALGGSQNPELMEILKKYAPPAGNFLALKTLDEVNNVKLAISELSNREVINENE